MPKIRVSRTHSVVERTREDALFSAFLLRQTIPAPRQRSAASTTPKDLRSVVRAIAKVRWAARRCLLLKKDRRRLERILESIPHRMQAGFVWRKLIVGGRGRPISQPRRYFLLAALVPYAKTTKHRGAWKWIRAELDHLGENIDRPLRVWQKLIRGIEKNGQDFDVLVAAGACSYFVFSQTLSRRILPGTPIKGRVAERIDDEKLTPAARRVLAEAARLLPALTKYQAAEPDIIDPTHAWGHKMWIA